MGASERSALRPANSNGLRNTPFNPALTPGARNAVQVCLAIQPSERVTLITDVASREIAASLLREIESVGAPCRAFVLEEVAPRPLESFPEEILADMEQSQVSIFAV